ncbi:MAG: hypothetical protein PHX68_00520 [Alphaproteobacteria bacterium]|nr:hypothetical protein [Alphaproteobacteria bacterium]
MSIIYFKKLAKNLLNDYKKQKYSATLRVGKHLKNIDNFCLMKAQHIIAKEAGFSKWNELQQAPEQYLDYSKIINSNPMITYFGFGIYPRENESQLNQEKRFQTEREKLFNEYELVLKISNWLRMNICKTKTLNRRHTSYRYKHMMEQIFNITEPTHIYVSNGCFIIATILAGFAFQKCGKSSPNCYFNMSEKSWNAIIAQLLKNK